MNQILFIEKSKNNGPSDIRKIAKISAIVIIVFAVIFIGKGVYGVVNNAKNKDAIEPSVMIKEVEDSLTEDKLELNISHKKVIDKVIYSWNNGQETTLQGRGNTQLIEQIDLPSGNNVLSIKVIDIDKNTTTFTKSFSKDDSKDTKKPQIEFSQDTTKAKIVVRDNKNLKSVSYYWNNEDPTVVNLEGQNLNKYEEKIDDTPKGKNTLNVIAIDESGNEQKESQIYNLAKNPTVSIMQDGDKVIITTSDEQNIDKIELTLNGKFFSTDSENTGVKLNLQEAQITQPLVQGENTIEVTVYSASGLSKTESKKITL